MSARLFLVTGGGANEALQATAPAPGASMGSQNTPPSPLIGHNGQSPCKLTNFYVPGLQLQACFPCSPQQTFSHVSRLTIYCSLSFASFARFLPSFAPPGPRRFRLLWHPLAASSARCKLSVLRPSLLRSAGTHPLERLTIRTTLDILPSFTALFSRFVARFHRLPRYSIDFQLLPHSSGHPPRRHGPRDYSIRVSIHPAGRRHHWRAGRPGRRSLVKQPETYLHSSSRWWLWRWPWHG